MSIYTSAWKLGRRGLNSTAMRRAWGQAGEYGIKGVGLGLGAAGLGLGGGYAVKRIGVGLGVGLDRFGSGLGSGVGNVAEQALGGIGAGVQAGAASAEKATMDLVKPALLVGGGFLLYKLIKEAV